MVAKARKARKTDEKPSKATEENISSYPTNTDIHTGDAAHSVRKQQINEKQGPSGNNNHVADSNLRTQQDKDVGFAGGAHDSGENATNERPNASNEEDDSETKVLETGLEEQQEVKKVRRRTSSRSQKPKLVEKTPKPRTRRSKTAGKDLAKEGGVYIDSDKENENTKPKSRKDISSNTALGKESEPSSRRRRGRPRKAKMTQEDPEHSQALVEDSSKIVKADEGGATVKENEISKPESHTLLGSRKGIGSLEEKKISVHEKDYERGIDTQSTKSNREVNYDGTSVTETSDGSVKSVSAGPDDYSDKKFGASVLTTQRHEPRADAMDHTMSSKKERSDTGDAKQVMTERDADDINRKLENFTGTVEGPEEGPQLQPRPYAEELVLKETSFQDGRYGTCFNCGQPVVIPGLAQFYCEKCGWIRRPIEMKSITPGHHD